MKLLGISFVLTLAAIFTPIKGLSEVRTSQKIYIDSSKLCFSDEGIFLETLHHGWRQISQIHHDAKGYYLVRYSRAHKKSQGEEVWVCPSCKYENTTTSGVCENCLWPLYEQDW